MLAGTVVATVGAYAFQLLGGRALGAEDFAPITVLWSVQFLVMTVVMLPVEQLIIRRLELTRGRSAGLDDSVVPLVALLLGTVLCATTAMALLGQRLTAANAWYAVMAGLLVAGYTVFAAARGYLAGRHRYRDYGIATAAEAVGRLVLAAAVLLVTRDGVGLAVVMVLAPLCVLVARPFARTRGPAGAEEAPQDDLPADVLVGRAGRFLGTLVLANGAAQTMLGIGPLVVAAVGANASLVSAVFVTFTLFRGPLWIIQSVLARVLPPFTALARRGDRLALQRWALRLAALGAVLAVVAGPLGWWLGPELVGLLFGEQFTPSAELTALVAAGTALAAMTTLSSQILIALGSTWDVALAWTVALALATVVFLSGLGGEPDVRVGLAFLAGECTALVLVTLFARLSRTDGPPWARRRVTAAVTS
jgi:O-antigen/teichoic acid export membrane protein